LRHHHNRSAVWFPGKRGNRNRTRDQQPRLSTSLRNSPELVCSAILPAKISEPSAIRGKSGGDILCPIWSLGDRLFSATGNRLPGDWARLEVPNSGGLLRWAFLHAAYSADADSVFAGFPAAVAMVSYVSETEPERRLLFSAADPHEVDRFMGWDSMVGFIVEGHDQAEQQVELWSSDGRRDRGAIGGISLSVRFTENLVATIPIADDTLDLTRATLPKGLVVRELPVK